MIATKANKASGYLRQRTLASALGAVVALVAVPAGASADTRIAWSEYSKDGTRGKIVSAAPPLLG